ncbi:MAG: CinA family protein [Oscillospiraceae bacterium]|nr:CinA family protein [Oscillospiraceae bacterium]
MPGDKAEQLVRLLEKRKLTIATAESLTGGRIAAAITAVPGSSNVFPGGVVSYCDRIKHEVLGVPEELLSEYGAVSASVAEAMARGAARLMGTDLALSATGLAGPDGDGSPNPVGTVFLGLYAQGEVRVERHVFSGVRESVRDQSVAQALKMALWWLESGE